MKNLHLTKKDYGDTRSLAFADFRSQRDKKRLDVSPPDRPIHGAGENQSERGFVTLLHEEVGTRL